MIITVLGPLVFDWVQHTSVLNPLVFGREGLARWRLEYIMC